MATVGGRSVWWAVLRGLPALGVLLLVVGAVVAAPTLLADSLPGRLAGVLIGTLLLVAFARGLTRRTRSIGTTGTVGTARRIELGSVTFDVAADTHPVRPRRLFGEGF